MSGLWAHEGWPTISLSLWERLICHGETGGGCNVKQGDKLVGSGNSPGVLLGAWTRAMGQEWRERSRFRKYLGGRVGKTGWRGEGEVQFRGWMGKLLYFIIELSWKSGCLSLWSLGIYKHMLIVKFTFFLHGTIPFLYKLRWSDFEKNYKDWKVFNYVHLTSEFLTLSETLNFNDNIQNLKDIFWLFCLSFLFWKCRDIVAGIASPGVMWFSDISIDIFSFDTRYWRVWERRGRWLNLQQDMTAKLDSTKWHLQQVFCGARVRKGFFLYF